jgi:hypothetical protein
MKDIEIPLNKDKNAIYRFFEILPGVLTWCLLALPFVLSLVSPSLGAYFVIAYLLMWFTKAVGMNVRVLQGWRTMQEHEKTDWNRLLDDTADPAMSIMNPDSNLPSWHYNNLRRIASRGPNCLPNELIHVAIVATVNESREILEPTIKALLDAEYDSKRIILVLAYEGRAGQATKDRVELLAKDYGHHFMHTLTVEHPADIPNEVIGKGGNITYAAREVERLLIEQKIDSSKVLVTTLDSDNRPHPKYFGALSYTYIVCDDALHSSFQPIPMFLNNIWDVPAPMRVIATGNSFWMIVQALRPHILRNFSAHAQSMQALIDTDYWSVRTIVEDGHQFWRTYFRYNGRHQVLPIFVPIYQDAVLAQGYRRTLKAQFIQIRRWAWGASDIAYVAYKGYFTKNKVPKSDLTLKFLRLLEGHISWSTAPLILAFSGFLPLYVNSGSNKSFIALQLPHITSQVQTIATAGLLITLFLSLKSLPPKPERYRRHRTFFMIIQWAYLPLTTIVYSCFAAIYSQTRLMFGLYLGKFDVTEKAVKK